MSENAIQNRYEFVMLYDVENGNPNGDPDAGNMPRLDPETGHGIVTDVCVKRKIRNYIELTQSGRTGYNIYVRQGAILNQQDDLGLDAIKNVAAEEKDKKKKKDERSLRFREFMCREFFDIRTFGAVMTKAATDETISNTAGQVRGPVQLAFGRSIDPIITSEITITRVAVTTEKDAERKDNEMGRKNIVPYGLYRQEGFISANLAQKVTGFSEADLELFFQAIVHMFDEDRSAAHGKMTLRELVVFKHESALGNAPAQKLFDLVTVKRRDGVAAPRGYNDYVVTVDAATLPAGVTLERKA